MSVSVWVSNPKPVHIKAVFPRIRATMKSLLGLNYEPELVLEDSSFTNLSQTDYIEPNTECGFDVYVKDQSPVTRVFSYRGADRFVIIPQNPSCYTVAAAVAIVLAENPESRIVDIQSTFSKKEYLSSMEFLELIKVRGQFADLNEATRAFLGREFELTGKQSCL